MKKPKKKARKMIAKQINGHQPNRNKNFYEMLSDYDHSDPPIMPCPPNRFQNQRQPIKSFSSW
jgi:hypothetical protein